MQFKKYQHIERFGTTEVKGIENGTVFVFSKVDGSNAQTYIGDDGQIKAGSRNRELTIENDNAGFCKFVSENENIQNFHKNYPHLRLYMEWLTPHTLKTYKDEAWRKAYVFDVYSQTNIIDMEGHAVEIPLEYDQYQPLMAQHGIECIPPIKIIKNGTYEDFLHELQNNTYLIKDGEGVGEGCFHKQTKITMWDGSYKRIGDIKVGDIVKSYNHTTNTIENKKVINVFMNGLKPLNDWTKIMVYPKGIAGRGSNSKAITCTNNHKFFDGNDYKEVSSLNNVYHYEKLIDDYRKQFILGWLVSDGHCSNNIIYISQRTKNIKTIIDILKDFMNKQTFFTSGKGSDMSVINIQKKFTDIYFKKYLKNDKVNFIEAFKDLDDVGWAALFMGDGSGGNRCQISFASNTKEECIIARDIFNNRFNCNATLTYDKRVSNGSGGTLNVNRQDRINFLIRISQYIVPELRYKLKGIKNINEFVFPENVQFGIVERQLYKKVSAINLKQYKRYENIEAYDIEIEDNHNYFAENCLVHNCVLKRYDFKNRYGRTTWAKIVTAEFKAKHIKTMGAPGAPGAPGCENRMVEQDIVDKYVTETFVQKELAKIININEDTWSSKLIPQFLQTVFYELIIEECWNFIKDFKYPTINFKILRSLTNNKIKELKSNLF
jgi:hypothetical protein